MNLKYGWRAYALVSLMMLFGVPLRADVLAGLWQWFAVPAGLPGIGMAHAYGLSLLAHCATHVGVIKDRDVADAASTEQEATSKQRAMWVGVHFVQSILAPLLALVMGYVAHKIMGVT